mmetsp:Transcript_15696/g.24414  ORF Transcript_15696/g.24414 Transcript_15696/m.24414 type:complete len:332 (-) Transcript_15696:119-1114(-)
MHFLVLGFLLTTFMMVSAFAVGGTTKETSSLTKTDAVQNANRGEQHPQKMINDRLNPWERRWANNQIGWHINDIHDSLYSHGSAIVPGFSLPSSLEEEQNTADTNSNNTCTSSFSANVNNGNDDNDDGVRVFVPLCGKTLDMAFLANQKGVKEVVGIDGIRKALVEFQQEHPSFQIQSIDQTNNNNYHDKLEVFQGNKITLLKGDYFELLPPNSPSSRSTIGTFDAIYDRASIVAIQPPLRQHYVQILGQLLKPGGTILMSTLDRRTGDEKARKAGPPFSVDELEVESLFGSQEWVESITKVREVDELTDRFKSQGLTSMFEMTFIIRAKE